MLKVIEPKLNRKWYSLIWAAIILASLLRGAYQTVGVIQSLAGDTLGNYLINIFLRILTDGLLPAWLCYACASIIFSMSWKRRIVYCHRNDFIYLTMIFTAGARALMGAIDLFAFMEPAIIDYTSMFLNAAVLSAALFIMYFAVLVPKYMNTEQAYRVFSLYSMPYVMIQSVYTAAPCLMVFIVGSDATLAARLNEMMQQFYGYDLTFNASMEIGAIIGMSVVAALILVTFLANWILQRRFKANPPAPEPEPEDNGASGGYSPFEEYKPPKEEKVFEEFDM